MWVRVLSAATGLPITNATFTYNWYNDGNGWYWVAVGSNVTFTVNASGYNGAWINSDYYASYVQWLSVYKPPPPSSGNCWS